jgi:hypothetical protein
MASGPEPCSYSERSVYVSEMENVHVTDWDERWTIKMSREVSANRCGCVQCRFVAPKKPR